MPVGEPEGVLSRLKALSPLLRCPSPCNHLDKGRKVEPKRVKLTFLMRVKSGNNCVADDGNYNHDDAEKEPHVKEFEVGRTGDTLKLTSS